MLRFESQLREWRAALQASRSDIERTRSIRDEIVEFRRARRAEGWELRLGSLDIQLRGYRQDDATTQGFRRMVLAVGERGEVRYVTGSDNHIQLDQELNERLRQTPPREPLEPHYLWYRRIEGVLELAGADSQPRESHERLSLYVEQHKSDLVKVLYRLV